MIQNPKAYVGFLVGVGGKEIEYKARAYVQSGAGTHGGIIIVLNGQGKLQILDNEHDGVVLSETQITDNPKSIPEMEWIISASFSKSKDGNLTVVANAQSVSNAKPATSLTLTGLPVRYFEGGISVLAQGKVATNITSFWWKDLRISGSSFIASPNQHYGPVWNAMYTLHQNKLKLTAQLAALGYRDTSSVQFWTKPVGSNEYKLQATSKVHFPGWYAHFALSGWDATQEYDCLIKVALGKDLN